MNGNFCHYCGNANCLMCNCLFMEEDVKLGKILRNDQGLIIPPNGNFVLQQMAGFDSITMRDRVYEWHRCNSNSLANAGAGTMAQHFNFEVVSDDHEAHAVTNFQLSTSDQIDQLEQELYALRQVQSRRELFNGVVIPLYRGLRSQPTSPFRPD